MSTREPKSEAASGGEAAAALAGRLGARFGSLVQRGNSWANRVADSVKEVSRGGLLRQAFDARERGNLAAAFWLLEEDYRARPDDLESAAAFWDVAVEFERAEDAVPAVAGLIRRHATSDGGDLAVQYWCELAPRVPGALADPAALVRIVPALQTRVAACSDDESRSRQQENLLQALRAVVDPRNSGLTPGLALRTVELARDLDPPTALAAARVALQSADLHEAKRARLVELVAALDPAAAVVVAAEPPAESAKPAVQVEPTAAPAPAPIVDPARSHPARTESPVHQPLSEEVVASLQSRLPPPVSAIPASLPADSETPPAAPARPDIKVMAGVLHALDDAAVHIEVAPGRRARVEYDKIGALAVAQIPGPAGEPALVVIDLLLERGVEATGPRRVVRLQRAVSEPGLCELLSGILERSRAVPLPDPDAALGLAIPSFDSLEAYEREILSSALERGEPRR